jgi:hypothetical protein
VPSIFVSRNGNPKKKDEGKEVEEVEEAEEKEEEESIARHHRISLFPSVTAPVVRHLSQAPLSPRSVHTAKGKRKRVSE